MGIHITGTGSYAPEKILTNADLEKMVETNDEWIRTRTGISERHIAAPDQATSDLAAEAGRRALESAGVKAEDIDVIVIATVTPDHSFPSVGCIVQNRLGAVNAMAFDLEAACTGLLYSLNVASGLLAYNRKFRNALVICGDKLSSITDWKDRSTCVLFGDAASAVLLSKDDSDDDFMLASDLRADGAYTEILKLPAGGSRMPNTEETIQQRLNYIHMDGREVFKLAVNGMVNSSKKVLEEAGVTPDQIKLVIPHQANARIIEAVAKRLNVTEDAVYINVNRYGNTSAASIGICIDEAVRAGTLKKGDLMLITAFGGGLTWGAQLIRM